MTPFDATRQTDEEVDRNYALRITEDKSYRFLKLVEMHSVRSPKKKKKSRMWTRKGTFTESVRVSEGEWGERYSEKAVRDAKSVSFGVVE